MPNRLALSAQSNKYKAMQIVAAAEHVLRRHRQHMLPLASLRNFLFLQLDAPLGSAVHATPLFAAMKQAMPDAYISVAASVMSASVLRHNPWVDACEILPDPSQSFLACVAAMRRLYKNLPDGPVCIVTTTGNQRPILALVAMLAGRATRVGYTLALPLYHLALDFDADRPQIENNLAILWELGHERATHEAPQKLSQEPHVFFSHEDEETAARYLSDWAASPQGRIAVVTQCSGLEPKSWSGERFREVIATLQETTGVTPIFLGTASEADAIEKLRSTLEEPGISLAGRTNISELAAVLSQCDWILGLDTGTFHVARAVGLPGVVLAPAWQNPVEWLPVDDPRYCILCGYTTGAPATASGLWNRSVYQMEEISVDQVISATLLLMRSNPKQ